METMIVRVKNKLDARKLMQFSETNGWQARSFDQMLSKFIHTADAQTEESTMARIIAATVRVGNQRKIGLLNGKVSFKTKGTGKITEKEFLGI